MAIIGVEILFVKIILFSLVIYKFTTALPNDALIENTGDHIMAKAMLAIMANFEK